MSENTIWYAMRLSHNLLKTITILFYNSSQRLQQQQQMLDSSTREMVVCFSQFLTDITAIIANIKQYVYQMINISIHIPKINIVYRSMSSIVLSTHRTFDDLKQIQSIISGVARSRSLHRKQPFFNTISHTFNRCRSQSEATEIFYSPRDRFKGKRNNFYSSAQEKSVTETVKRGSNPKILIKQQPAKRNNFEEQTLPKINHQNAKTLLSKQMHIITRRTAKGYIIYIAVKNRVKVEKVNSQQQANSIKFCAEESDLSLVNKFNKNLNQHNFLNLAYTYSVGLIAGPFLSNDIYYKMQYIRSKVFFRVQSAVEIHVGLDSTYQTIQSRNLFEMILGLQITPQTNVHFLPLLYQLIFEQQICEQDGGAFFIKTVSFTIGIGVLGVIFVVFTRKRSRQLRDRGDAVCSLDGKQLQGVSNVNQGLSLFTIGRGRSLTRS